MMKTLARFLSLLLSSSLLCTCALAEESPFTRQMVERSLFQVGNTQRIHKAIEKARAGEKVSLVYLGGSITEGALAQPQKTHCYAAVSARLFAEKFMPDASQLAYHNAGISGTPSLLGVTRCAQDVLSHQPDIVFVEFAVNDGTDDQSRMAYESLVRMLLQSETQPAVVLIITVMSGGYSAHVHMKQVGRHYDLGVVSVFDAVWPQVSVTKALQWSDYSSDYAHPTTEGHAFIADMIGYYFDQAAATEATEYAIPAEARYAKDLESLRNIRQGDAAIVSEGSFPAGVVTSYSYTKGWKHSKTSGDDPMVLQVTGSAMTFVFKQENNKACGTAEILVDGQVKTTLPGYGESAWGQPVTQLVSLGENAQHTIEIRMAQGDEAKNFNLLDMAVAAQ